MGEHAKTGAILRGTFALYTRHASVFIGWSFAVQFTGIVLVFALFGQVSLSTGLWLLILVPILAMLLQASLVTRLAMALRAGVRVDPATLVLESCLRVFPASLVMTLVVLPLLVVTVVGPAISPLAIIIGFLASLYVMLRWTLAPSLSMMGHTIGSVFGASWRIVNNQTGGTVVVVAIVAGLAQGVASTGVGIVNGPIDGPAGLEQYLLLSALVAAVVGPLPWIAYTELVVRLAHSTVSPAAAHHRHGPVAAHVPHAAAPIAAHVPHAAAPIAAHVPHAAAPIAAHVPHAAAPIAAHVPHAAPEAPAPVPGEPTPRLSGESIGPPGM